MKVSFERPIKLTTSCETDKQTEKNVKNVGVIIKD